MWSLGQPGTIDLRQGLTAGTGRELTQQAEWGVGQVTVHARMLLQMKGGVTERYSGTKGVDEGVLGKLGFRDWADTEEEVMRAPNGLPTTVEGIFRKNSLES